MITRRFLIKPKNGQLKFVRNERDLFVEALKHFDNKLIWLSLKKPFNQRTLQQNKYYWAVPIALISEALGYEKDEVHEILKWKFLLIPGEYGKPDRVRSTRDLSTEEWETYMDEVRRWAVQEPCLQLNIPEPNEVEI